MVQNDDNSDARKSRRWARGERSKVSVMHAFRSAHAAHDSRVDRARNEDSGTEVTTRSRQRREGLSEDALKAHINADLTALMNTINLDSAVSLEDTPLVARSVINFGFRDLSDVSAKDLGSAEVIRSIRRSLIDHEPRINPDSVEIEILDDTDRLNRRLALHISAELMGDPVDIPMDFNADVDLGSGKLNMNNLRMQL